MLVVVAFMNVTSVLIRRRIVPRFCSGEIFTFCYYNRLLEQHYALSDGKHNNNTTTTILLLPNSIQLSVTCLEIFRSSWNLYTKDDSVLCVIHTSYTPYQVPGIH